MVLRIDCKEIRDQLQAESLACINPYPNQFGWYKINKWVTYRGTIIHCDFFERELGWEFYIDKNIFYIKKNNTEIFTAFDGCGVTERDFAKLLFINNKEMLLLFLYNLFSNICVKSRAAYSAYSATFDAASAADAATAAYKAYAYAATVYAASAAVYATAAATAAYEAYAYAAAAYAASAANAAGAAAAANAVKAVIDMRKFSRKAFRELIKFRKEVL